MPGWSGTRGCGTNPNWPSGTTTSDTPGAKSIGKPFSSFQSTLHVQRSLLGAVAVVGAQARSGSRVVLEFCHFGVTTGAAKGQHAHAQEGWTLCKRVDLGVQRLGRPWPWMCASTLRFRARRDSCPASSTGPGKRPGMASTTPWPASRNWSSHHSRHAPWVDIALRDNGVGLSRTTASTDAPKEHVSMGTEITSMRLREVHPRARFELREALAPWSTEVVISLPLVVPNS